MSLQNFRYCPRCQVALVTKEQDQTTYKQCPHCGHRQYQEPKVSVVARIAHRNKLLLIQRAVNPRLGHWGFPGGFLNVNEMPEAALKREVREETSLTISVKALLEIFPMEGRGPGIPGIVLAYDCACLSNPESARAADDAKQVRWCGPGQIPVPIAFSSTQYMIQQWLRQG